jgi:hypothetical protein
MVNIIQTPLRYWLDYGSVVFPVLMIALGFVELLVLGI